MVNALKYPALNAKMKGMYANKFSESELEELLRQTNLKDAIIILKSKFPGLENIDESMHRKKLEQELNNLFIIDILKLYKYLNKDEKEVFMEFISKYELNCIKNVFRNLTTNKETSTNLKNIDNWTNKIFTSIDGINQISKEKDFLELIKSKKYYDIFKEYEEVIEKAPLEDIEVKLDQFYFKRVYDLSKKINKTFEKMIGTEIDLLNIIWIFRSKEYFHYSEEEIKQIIIPINYKLTKSKMDELLLTTDFDDIKAVLSETIYKDVFTYKENIEHDKDKFLYNMYMKFFRTKLFNICTLFCNINLIDIEIKNIINIIEGIRYKIDKVEIQKKIII